MTGRGLSLDAILAKWKIGSVRLHPVYPLLAAKYIPE
jgi:hypothetical protein